MITFNIDDIPVPALLVDLRAASSLVRRSRSGDHTLDEAEVAAAVRASAIIDTNVNAMELFESPGRCQMDNANCFRDEFYARSREFIIALASGQQTPWFETTVYTLAGEPIPAMTRARPVGGPDDYLLLWSIAEIRDVKFAEQQAVAAKLEADEANRSKSSFLAVMSHEIRTPLNGILGMAQLLERRDLASDDRDMVSVISRSGTALLSVLNDVLDLAKIEAGRLEIEAIEFDLEEVIDQAHSVFAAIAQDRGLAFDHTIAPEALGAYVGDPTRIRQILFNLISNALKFTSAGGVSVRVVRDRGDLVVGVRDTGIGIPADKLATLFEKFTQVDASTTRRFGGTGLGLSICDDLCRLMGGRILVESAVGEGSTFTLRLPLEQLDQGSSRPSANDAAPACSQAAPTLGGQPLKVLAAEDNLANQMVLRGVMTAVGADITIVGDGIQALAALAEQSFDVVLMDIQMPNMDGVTAITELRRLEKADGRPRQPVIALSANAMTEQIAQYRTAGMDDHIEKPFQIADLLAAIERVVDGDRVPVAPHAAALA